MIPVQTNTYRFMAECKNILGRILCIPSCSFVSLLWPRQKNVAITCINYYVNFYHIHCTQMIDGVGGKPSRDPVYHLPVDGIPLTTAFRDLWFHLPTAHRYSSLSLSLSLSNSLSLTLFCANGTWMCFTSARIIAVYVNLHGIEGKFFKYAVAPRGG